MKINLAIITLPALLIALSNPVFSKDLKQAQPAQKEAQGEYRYDFGGASIYQPDRRSINNPKQDQKEAQGGYRYDFGGAGIYQPKRRY